MPPAKKPSTSKKASKDRSRSPRGKAKATEKAADVTPSAVLTEMPAVVVNLERRPDRWQRVEGMLQKDLPWLKFERFFASDGKAHDIPERAVSKTWNTKCNAMFGEYEDTFKEDGTTLVYSKAEFENPGVEYQFSPGERGCAHSHYRVWEKAVDAPGPILVLEDDVKLEFERTGGMGNNDGKNFTKRLEVGMAEAAKKGNVDVLYLGWSGYREGNYKHLKAARGRKNAILRKVEYVWTTVAYVLWPQGARKLLDASKPLNQPVDNFMAWECFEGRLNSFVLLDEGDGDGDWSGGIVDQFDFANDSDVTKSDGGHQGHSATEFLAASPDKSEAKDAAGLEVAGA